MNNLDNFDKFSFSRFMMLAKREIISSKNIFLMELAVVAGLIIIAEFFISWSALPSLNDVKEYPSCYYSDSTCVSIIFVLGIWGFAFLANIAASLVCLKLSNKKGRITTFMTVGTQGEKYLLNFLIYDVFFVLYFFTVWLLVDLVRVIYVDMVYPFEGKWVLFYAIDQWNWMVALGTIALFLFSQAFYTLVSAFSPKLAFLKAFGLSYAVGFLLIPYSFFCSVVLIDKSFSGESNVIVIMASSVMIIYAIAMQLLAYYRYKETDII
ncbi:MAG: hypothetical protein K2O00_09285 [Muribaculaceae bacterium]|nr:hypothetical protein [Muribaculaceae bacterium]